MNILITGGNGATAYYFLKFLETLKVDLEIHATTRLKNSKLISEFKTINFHELDLLDKDKIFNLIKTIKPQKVFHFASNADVKRSFDEPELFLENNIISTSNLLEGIRYHSRSSRLMMCSTSEVYGNPSTNKPVDENSAIAPINPYAVSKVAQDLLASVYYKSYNLDIIITRMFSYINPKRENLALSAFARRLHNIKRGKESILKHGYLGSKRTFIDVRDAVECYWEITKNGKSGEIYNLGGEQAYSIEECLDMLIEHTGIKVKKESDPSLVRPTDIKVQIPDISKFQSVSNWKPKYTIEDSIKFLWEETQRLVKD